jgi:alpha-L-fucosidase 2
LEGNFAFAAGVQEMLLQSQGGVVRVFPAVPDDWKEVSFKNLRAEGAFLVSANIQNGKTRRVEVFSEKGGDLNIQLPPGKWILEGKNGEQVSGMWRGKMRKGERVVFLNLEN